MRIILYLICIRNLVCLCFAMHFMMWLHGCKRPKTLSEEFAATPSGLKDENSKANVEINSSVAVLGVWDYALVNGSSPCLKMVDKALGPGFANSMINFLPTHGFLLDPPEIESQKLAERSLKRGDVAKTLTWGDRICYRMSEKECVSPTQKMIKSFEDGMAACFERAIINGAGISITPHLDDGQRKGRWRNSHVLGLVVDDDWTCEKNTDSFYCAMLVPLANAIKHTRKYGKKVYFSLQGEMGATIFANLIQYAQAIDELRAIIPSSSDDEVPIKMGISLNFNKIFGNFPTHKIEPKEFKKLLSKIDFFGASAYPSLTLAKDGSLAYSQFDQVFDGVNYELAPIKTDLKRDGARLEYIFSEVGIGGSSDGVKPATSAEEALSAPWAGVHGTFDPKKNPWAHSDVAEGAKRFYCALSLYLSRKTVPPQGWRVKGAFIWNLASWDIQGLYHASSAPKHGSYLIPDLALALKNYNEGEAFDCAASEKISPLPAEPEAPISPAQPPTPPPTEVY